jgi:hypothetical protein
MIATKQMLATEQMIGLVFSSLYSAGHGYGTIFPGISYIE